MSATPTNPVPEPRKKKVHEPAVLYGFGWPPQEMCVTASGKLLVRNKPKARREKT